MIIRSNPTRAFTGMVALPHQDVQLQIFEARYRVLFHTLLAGGAGCASLHCSYQRHAEQHDNTRHASGRKFACRIVEDLVQEDSPFKGSKRFGMCLLTGDGLSTYGTVLEVIHHKVLPDARLLTVSKGRERFKLVKIIQERPVLLCEVEYLEDNEDEESLQDASDELKSLFRDVLELNARYKNVPVDEEFLVCLALAVHDDTAPCAVTYPDVHVRVRQYHSFCVECVAAAPVSKKGMLRFCFDAGSTGVG